MGHGLSRCFPFSNKSFYRLTIKAHFVVLLVVCNKYVLYVYICVQESHVCNTDFHLGI